MVLLIFPSLSLSFRIVLWALSSPPTVIDEYFNKLFPLGRIPQTTKQFDIEFS